jgi:hypothetical protein
MCNVQAQDSGRNSICNATFTSMKENGTLFGVKNASNMTKIHAFLNEVLGKDTQNISGVTNTLIAPATSGTIAKVFSKDSSSSDGFPKSLSKGKFKLPSSFSAYEVKALPL